MGDCRVKQFVFGVILFLVLWAPPAFADKKRCVDDIEKRFPCSFIDPSSGLIDGGYAGRCMINRSKLIRDTCYKSNSGESVNFNNKQKGVPHDREKDIGDSGTIPAWNNANVDDDGTSKEDLCNALDVNASIFAFETDELERLKLTYFDHRTRQAIQAARYYDEIRQSTFDFLVGEMADTLKAPIEESTIEIMSRRIAFAFKEHILDASKEISKETAEKIVNEVLDKFPEFGRRVSSHAARAAIFLKLAVHIATNSARIYKLAQTASTGDLESMIYREQEYLSSRSKTLKNYYRSSDCNPHEQFINNQRKLNILTSDIGHFSQKHRDQGKPFISFPVDTTPYTMHDNKAGRVQPDSEQDIYTNPVTGQKLIRVGPGLTK